MATEKNKQTPKPKRKKKETVSVIWPHSIGNPGDLKVVYGVLVTADKDGVFRAEITPEKAALEEMRENLFRFAKDEK